MAALSEMVAETCTAAEVEIHHLGIRKETLHGGVSFRWTGNPCRANPRLNLSIVAESGEATRLVVQPALTIWIHAPVAARDYTAGERVEPKLGRVKIQAVRGIAAPHGGEARVPIAAGKPITNMNVRVPYDSRIGTDVILEVIRGPITLTATGRIMANARIGDEVRVVNHHTQTVLKGKLIEPGKVRVQ